MFRDLIHSSSLLYLLPSLVAALIIRYFSRFMVVAWFLRLPGLLVHELLHFAVAFLTFAHPVWLTVLPRRNSDGGWTLGSVTLLNVRWYNAVWVSIAPLLCLPLLAWLIAWRLRSGFTPSIMDIVYWYGGANLLLAAWPSSIDFQIALRSWPLFVSLAAAWYYRWDTVLGIRWSW